MQSICTNQVNYRSLTPLSFLTRTAQVFPDKTALVYRQQQWTYAQFAARINQLASALQTWGLQKGDRVAFLCPNIPPMAAAHFGVPLAGGVLVALNIRLAAQDIRYILNDAGVRIVFVDTEFAHLVEDVRSQLTTVEEVVNIVDTLANTSKELLGLEYEGFLATGTTESIDLDLADEEALISINYTSGTSGQPKGVMYTHRGGLSECLG